MSGRADTWKSCPMCDEYGYDEKEFKVIEVGKDPLGLEAMAKHDAAVARAAFLAGAEKYAELTRNLLAAYDRSLLDISARIPTALHAACEAFRDFKGPK